MRADVQCGCGAPTGDGAALCQHCTRELRATLILAANIAADLQDAVARQLNRGTAMRQAGKPEPPLLFDLAAMAARSRLLIILNYWCLQLARRQISTVAGAAITLTAHLDGFRQDPAAWHAATEITAAVAAAVTVIDRRPDLRPAGECEACGAPLRAEPAADTASCPRCGHVTAGIAQRRAERAAAADLLGTATEISGQLAMIGIRVAAGTIRMWGSRGRLVSRPGLRDGQPVYAMSEALVLIAERDARAAS